MKKLLVVLLPALFLFFGLAFHSIQASASYYPGKKVSPKEGDILITSKKTTKYHTGHAAIVSDDLRVVQIAGPGKHPTISTLKKWTAIYPIKNVVRFRDSTKAKAAGKWARTYQSKYKNASYGIWTNLDTFKSTYCSKLVWQSYKYGAKTDLTQRFFFRSGAWIPTSAYLKIAPYDFLTGITRYRMAKW